MPRVRELLTINSSPRRGATRGYPEREVRRNTYIRPRVSLSSVRGSEGTATRRLPGGFHRAGGGNFERATPGGGSQFVLNRGICVFPDGIDLGLGFARRQDRNPPARLLSLSRASIADNSRINAADVRIRALRAPFSYVVVEKRVLLHVRNASAISRIFRVTKNETRVTTQYYLLASTCKSEIDFDSFACRTRQLFRDVSR